MNYNSRCKICNCDLLDSCKNDEGLPLVKCDKCKLVFNKNILNDSIDDYSFDLDTYLSRSKIREKTFRMELNRIKKIITKGNLLDFGGGCGHFASLSLEYGYTPYLVELNSYSRNIAVKTFKITNVFKKLTDIPSYVFFDVVILNHVIEHVADPLRILNNLWPRMREGAIILLVQPNFDFYNSVYGKLLRKMKAMPNQIVSEGHLQCWSWTSLKIALERANFEIIKKVKPYSGYLLYNFLPFNIARFLRTTAYLCGFRPSFAVIAEK